MQFCVFDTETTGLPTPVETPDGIKLVYPRLVQLAWVILDQNLEEIAHASFIIQPDQWTIPDDVVKIHGITTSDAFLLGEPIHDVLAAFANAIAECTHIIAHDALADAQKVVRIFIRMVNTGDFTP